MTVFQPLIRAATLLAHRLESGDVTVVEDRVCLVQPMSLDGDADLAAWLAAQAGDEKLYWRARDGTAELAALGWGGRWQGDDALQELRTPSDLVRFWCSGFDPEQRWRGWPDALLLQPELAVLRDDGGWRVRVQCAPARAGELAVCLRRWHARMAMPQALPPVCRSDQPGLAAWCREVETARQSIAQRLLDKVVLARVTRLHASAELSLWSLFMQWRKLAQRCYQFVIQEGERGFLSFSPERLFLREQSAVFSEALAGTFWHSQSSPSLGCIDAKLSHEHALVVDDLKRKLAHCCEQLYADDAVGLYPQPNMQHLYCGFKGVLRADVADADLLRRLHPTAAVCGLPAAPARRLIRQHEDFARGWYAGCFGPLTERRSEIAVAIRSGKLEGSQLDLFAGAGIVTGSQAHLEWQELDRKIELPLSLFEVVDSDHSQETHVPLRASKS